MSSKRKSIQDAKSSCIDISKAIITRNNAVIAQPESNDDDDDDESDDQLNFTPKGDIVQYTSPWQARLGFFLLDKISASGKYNFFHKT